MTKVTSLRQPNTDEQNYREGKRVETYIVETLAYEDIPEQKLKRLHFVLAKIFEVNLTFMLLKISDEQTRFVYKGTNKGVNVVGRAMLKMGGPNNMATVSAFIGLVEKEALKASKA